MSRTIQTLITLLFIFCINSPTFADWKENAEAIDISGGEVHTLVLTKDKTAWSCGPNGHYYYDPQYRWYGVLGTGSNEYDLVEKILVDFVDGFVV